jgi:hypothetical protein
MSKFSFLRFMLLDDGFSFVHYEIKSKRVIEVS